MLVLSREKGERVVVILPDGQVAWIDIVDIRGEKVRLGLTFSKECQVHREEVYEAIQREKGESQSEDNTG